MAIPKKQREKIDSTYFLCLAVSCSIEISNESKYASSADFQNETLKQDIKMEQQSTLANNLPQEEFELCPIHPTLNHPLVDFGIDIMTLDGNERLKLATKELSIGRRIREELRIQGRTVSWLARQLCMERTNLYYTFRQNSIDTEMLLRISFFLNHNFLQDVSDVCRKYGL